MLPEVKLREAPIIEPADEDTVAGALPGLYPRSSCIAVNAAVVTDILRMNRHERLGSAC